MSTSPESGILFVGLTGTGKTNFLVALDLVLDNQVDPDGLVHSEHADDRTYLEPLRAQWLEGVELLHTSRLGPPPPHQLLLRHPASGTIATFYNPDLAGETFDSQFITRSLPHEFGLRMQRATGLILFLHCNHQADHELLEHPQFMDAEAACEASKTQPIAPVQVDDWSIEQASRQVKLVDLLQFIAELREYPLPIAVAISAWERVEKAADGLFPKEPSGFLVNLWPLLAQYLESNRDAFPFRTFGVSARGGGTSAKEIEQLIKLDQPRDRVIVVDGEHRSNDLTRPVRWLLGLLKNPDSSND
jgi:hypothetical protein